MSAPVTVSAIRIVDQFRTTIAILTPAGWRDPWGGSFDPADERALTSIASQSDGMYHVVRGQTIRHPKVYVTI